MKFKSLALFIFIDLFCINAIAVDCKKLARGGRYAEIQQKCIPIAEYDRNAAYVLGYMYEHQIYFTNDNYLAECFYKKSARLGDEQAKTNLLLLKNKFKYIGKSSQQIQGCE